MPTETFPCSCCCNTGKLCYREYFCTYTCSTETWAGPTPDNNVCLAPGDVLTGWTKDAEGATNCQYKIHVPLNKCCTENSDCSSGITEPTPPVLPTGIPDDCCCCASAKKCTKLWTSSYDCDTESWSTPVSGGIGCESTTRPTDTWLIDECNAEMYESCGPPCNCCDDVFDCDGCDGGGVTPSPPSETPTDCCNCECSSEDDCFNCGVTPGRTPSSITLTFNLEPTTKCQTQTGEPWTVSKLFGGGGTVTLTQKPGAPCAYVGEISFMTVKKCFGTEEDHDCDACEPDISQTTTVQIELVLGGGGASFSLYHISSDPLLGDFFIDLTAVTSVEWQNCCKPWEITYADFDGFETWYTFGNGTITGVPC